MCNCNQKVNYSNPGPSQHQGSVLVKLTGAEPVVVNGSVTGRMYIFRNINDTNWIDKRDAFELGKVNGLTVLY